MAKSRRMEKLFIAGLMVVTGCINTLSTKWADKQSAHGSKGVYDSGASCNSSTNSTDFYEFYMAEDDYCEETAANITHKHVFDHPFLQAVGMFIGEFSCFVVFKLIQYGVCRCITEPPKETINFPPIIFLVPACCDICATSMMYIGLTMTYASSFQMLRAAVIIFTGFVSMMVLKKNLKIHEWGGMVVVVIGLILVGLSDTLFGHESSSGSSVQHLKGDIIIVVAQVVVAFQMTWEEKFVKKHDVPALQAVGWEGIFGFCILTILLIPFYYIHYSVSQLEPPHFENAIDGLVQIGNNSQILAAVILNIVSIAFFNFAGISVTKLISAVTRMVLDSVRTLFIWAFSLAIGWQQFQWLQPIGFLVLVAGMVIYHWEDFRPVFLTMLGRPPVVINQETEPLLVNSSGKTSSTSSSTFH